MIYQQERNTVTARDLNTPQFYSFKGLRHCCQKFAVCGVVCHVWHVVWTVWCVVFGIWRVGLESSAWCGVRGVSYIVCGVVCGAGLCFLVLRVV
jgi:hypothetical protein